MGHGTCFQNFAHCFKNVKLSVIKVKAKFMMWTRTRENRFAPCDASGLMVLRQQISQYISHTTIQSHQRSQL